MAKAIVILVGGVALGLTAQAGAAGWVVQGIPGASCHTDARSTGQPEYRNQRLLNNQPDPWGIVVAVCPVSLYAPGVQPREYRINLRDPQRRETWCRAYSHDGTLVRTSWLNEGSTAPITGALDYPLGNSGGGLVEATLHCLVHSGASLDRIEIVWWKP
jgi:hypothetical protein